MNCALLNACAKVQMLLTHFFLAIMIVMPLLKGNKWKIIYFSHNAAQKARTIRRILKF